MLKAWPELEEVNAKFLSRMIEKTQERIENHFFEARKHVLEYDDVLNAQREHVYGMRRDILLGKHVREDLVSYIQEMVREIIRVNWALDENGVRVVITLARPGRYDVKTEGNAVVINVTARDEAPALDVAKEHEASARARAETEAAKLDAMKAREAAAKSDADRRALAVEREAILKAKAEADATRLAAAKDLEAATRAKADAEALTEGRAKVVVVTIHEVGEPAPEESWLEVHARLVDESQRQGARLRVFEPRSGERFAWRRSPGSPPGADGR